MTRPDATRGDMSPDAVATRLRAVSNSSMLGLSNQRATPISRDSAAVRLPIEFIDDEMAMVLREKTPVERLAISNGMWRTARRMIEAMLRREYPQWTNEEILRETALRMSHGTT